MTLPDRLRRVALLLLAPVVLLAAGCGGSAGGRKEDGSLSDREQVRQYIQSMGDIAGTPASFAKQFADGAAPAKADMAKYAAFEFNVAGDPTISGDSATVPVQVLKSGGGVDEVVGTTTWTLAKAGDGWKIKTAPLP
jgi:hypothetical protein